MKCATKECWDYDNDLINHCRSGLICPDYTCWKNKRIKDLEDMEAGSEIHLDLAAKRIKELETAMQDTLDWYIEYGVILKPQIDKLKQLLQK